MWFVGRAQGTATDASLLKQVAAPAGAAVSRDSAVAPTPAALAEHPLSWLIIACTLLGMILGAADQTIVSAAMPKILSSLAGFTQYAWVTTAYLLGVTITMPIYGKLADLYEAKWVFISALLLFVTGSALCGQAHSMSGLIVFRALQGLGAGAFAPVGIVIMSAFVTPERRSGVQGTAGGIVLVATVAGPVLGGWLADHSSWRWVFYINVPLGIAVAALLAIALPRLRSRHAGVRLDVLGVALLMLVVIPVLLVASIPMHQTTGLVRQHSDLLLAVAGISAAFFVVHELRHDEPLMNLHLFKKRFFVVTSITVTLLSALTLASLVYVPLYAQGVLSNSATIGGFILAPLMLASVSSRLIVNAVRRRRGYVRAITQGCLGLVVIGAVGLLLLHPTSSSAQLFAAMAALGAGLGAANMLLFAVALSPFPRSHYGQATGTLLFLRSLGGAIITGVLGNLLTSRFVAAMATDLPLGYRWLLRSRYAFLYDNPRLLLVHVRAGRSVHHPVIHAMHAALGSSLHDIFMVMLGVAAVSFALPALFPLRVTRQAEHEAALVTEGGVAAIGEVVLDETEAPVAANPTWREVATVWDVMCHVLYWRHGAVRFTEDGERSLHAFNRFEDDARFETSIESAALSRAFERSWSLTRHYTAVDRYRAEALVTLLAEMRHVEGDIVTCGGTGNGCAVLLALMVRELGLGRKVYQVDVTAGELGDDVDAAAAGNRSPLAEVIAGHDLSGILVPRSGSLHEALSALAPGQRFCLLYLDSAKYAFTRFCLARLLPLASTGATLVIGQYHNSQDGARRAVQERLRGDVALFAGPLPQVYCRLPLRHHADAAAVEPDWTQLSMNTAYPSFLRWIGRELAACYAGAETSRRDHHIVEALDRLGLPERADSLVERFANTLEGDNAMPGSSAGRTGSLDGQG
ncbi:MAG TPA: MDR family MFS transporter [Chloroflexota bacterium]|nr:MDR family MFS transporter [Chloroflexota bacterium]